ncbi:NERD domain-containing protein [Cryobacterium sp. BB736]|uniref:NERD domain-containing protein n=1 Tax=Cryobacterium sp. BB736 TaxID=2746963 RepID=UPI001874F374|nr:NERD domain-containing protein [Cryobacterium sp. BB736]
MQTTAVAAEVAEVLDRQSAVRARSPIARVVGVSPLRAETRAPYRSALALLALDDVLAELGPDWVTLCGVPVAGGTAPIDQLIIGPAGVIALTIRNAQGLQVWAGNGVFVVDGLEVPQLRESELAAALAETALSDATGDRVRVKPVVVVVNAASLIVSKPRRGVVVVSSRELRTWLLGLEPTMPPELQERIRDAASDALTWSMDAWPKGDTERILERFHALRTEVNRARRARVIWIVGLATVLWAAAIAAALTDALR